VGKKHCHAPYKGLKFSEGALVFNITGPDPLTCCGKDTSQPFAG